MDWDKKAKTIRELGIHFAYLIIDSEKNESLYTLMRSIVLNIAYRGEE